MEAENGLVHEEKLVVADGFTELRFKPYAGGNRGLHLRMERNEIAMGPGLCLGQGDVGVTEKLTGRIASSRGYPDARRHRAELTVLGKVERFSQRRKQVPGHVLGVWHAFGGLDQDHKLVAAEPADGVGLPHHGAEATGNLAQQLVSCGVAESVVDVFELVEVDEQSGHVGMVAASPSCHLLGAVENEGTVGEARQGVMARLVAELGGRALLEQLELAGGHGVLDRVRLHLNRWQRLRRFLFPKNISVGWHLRQLGHFFETGQRGCARRVDMRAEKQLVCHGRAMLHVGVQSV